MLDSERARPWFPELDSAGLSTPTPGLRRLVAAQLVLPPTMWEMPAGRAAEAMATGTVTVGDTDMGGGMDTVGAGVVAGVAGLVGVGAGVSASAGVVRGGAGAGDIPIIHIGE
jgi:hypothetical protein